MTSEEYYKIYGYDTKPKTPEQQAHWDSLSDPNKEDLKQHRPFYVGPGEQEQGMTEDWWNEFQQGPQTNIWEGLSEAFGFKPGAIKNFVMQKFGDLMKTPDFAKEYDLGKKALNQQLAEAERGMASKFAARGLLDSSAHAQAVGGAMGGYTQGLANLMLGKAGMEESARSNRFNQGMGMASQGLNFADFLNSQYLQKMGLGAEAINYLQQQRGQENAFNMQKYSINPNPHNPITTMEGILGGANVAGSLYSAIAGGGGFGGFDWGGGGGGGNMDIPTQPTNTWDNYNWDINR